VFVAVCRAVTDYRSMSYVSADVNRLRLYVIRSVLQLAVVINISSPHQPISRIGGVLISLSRPLSP